MNKISTKELFDEYFKTMKPTTVKKNRMLIDRAEVYEFEEKLGKQLVYMNVEELFEMILSFNNKKGNMATYSVTYASYSQIASLYRNMFEFYINNYEIIRNPFNDPRMKGIKAMDFLTKGKTKFSKEIVEDVIKRIYNEYDTPKAKYTECILQLYYNGFSKAEEIVSLTEDMIDFKNKSVTLPGRTIQLSDRCFELLTYVHNLTSMEGHRETYSACTWRNGYFKYIIREKERVNFDNRTLQDVAAIINRKVSVDIRGRFDVDINYRMLYFLGFYEYLEKNCGEERAKKVILSYRDDDDIKLLLRMARNYGVVVESVSYLKRMLRPFI